jgi:hypothetical protein
MELARQAELRRKEEDRLAAFKAIPAATLLQVADYFIDDREKWMAFTMISKEVYELSKEKVPAWPKSMKLVSPDGMIIPYEREWHVGLSSDGQWLYCVELNQTTTIYSLKKWNVRRGFVSRQEIGSFDQNLIVSADFRYIAGNDSHENSITVFDLQDTMDLEQNNRFVLHPPSHIKEGLGSLCRIHDNGHLQISYVETSDDRPWTLCIWDLSTRQKIIYQKEHIDEEWVNPLELGINFSILKSSHSRELGIWNLSDTNEMVRIPIECPGSIVAIQPNPENQNMLVCAMVEQETILHIHFCGPSR